MLNSFFFCYFHSKQTLILLWADCCFSTILVPADRSGVQIFLTESCPNSVYCAGSRLTFTCTVLNKERKKRTNPSLCGGRNSRASTAAAATDVLSLLLSASVSLCTSCLNQPTLQNRCQFVPFYICNKYDFCRISVRVLLFN